MNTTRRDFLRRTAAVAAASALTVPALGESPAAPPIIDTHQHLWDLSRVRPPWLKTPSEPLGRSFVTADYLQAVAGMGVVQTVYMEVDVDPPQFQAEADYVLGLCRSGKVPTRAAVLGGRPASADFPAYVARLKEDRNFKGIREIFRKRETAEGLSSNAALIAGLRLLGKLGLRFDLCVPPTTLAEAAKLVDACGDTRFVLDHCGNADVKAFAAKPSAEPSHTADQWRRGIEEIAKRKNVVCKISGIIARVEKDRWTPDDLAPIVNHCLDSFGPDRVMFAGDWPVCLKGASLRQWIEALREIVRGRSPALQRMLFHDNALQFYELDPIG